MEQLVSELRGTISRQRRLLQVSSSNDDVRRECCSNILQAIVSFLPSWESIADDDDSRIKQSNLPAALIRDGLTLILSEFGPGDKLRSALLQTLLLLKHTDARQIIYECLPWAMPSDQDKLEKETKVVIKALRGVLVDDDDELLPILGCLTALPLSQTGRREAYNIALASLKVVSEVDLPVLVQMLLRQVTSIDDARETLEAMRKEIFAVELSNDVDDVNSDDNNTNNGSDDAVTMVAHILLTSFQEGRHGGLLAEAYLSILCDLVTKRTVEWQDKESPDSSIVMKSDYSIRNDENFLLLDIVIMLALYEDSNYTHDFESDILDRMLQFNSFPFHSLNLLLQRWCRKHSKSILYDRIVSPLLSLSILLLLTPIRNKELTNAAYIMNKTHSFIVDFHHFLDQERLEELIHVLLHLSEESSHHHAERSQSILGGKNSSKRNKSLSVDHSTNGFTATSVAVHDTLQVLAISCRDTVVRFKHVLVSRLTSTGSRFDATSIKHVCHILSSLVEPAYSGSGIRSGIDASELIMLLQKLLFVSSHRHFRASVSQQPDGSDDGDRVVRGLILATELIKSPFVGTEDKNCIQQWVLRILHSPSGTRKNLEPEIGQCGLEFLLAWSSHDESKNGQSQSLYNTNASAYVHIKEILAHTGLIQRILHYQQRRKPSHQVMLGYTTMPQYYIKDSLIKSRGGDANTPRNKQFKKQDMIFCITSFLRHSDDPHPSRWSCLIDWIYQLVDVYLTLGRQEKTVTFSDTAGQAKTTYKWKPDGWVKATIELPAVLIEVEEVTDGKESIAIDKWIGSYLKTFDVSTEKCLNNGITYSDITIAVFANKSLEQITEHVESLFKLSLVIVLSISLSFAVLGNTYKHFICLDNRRQAILKLMQYQLLKIYDLKSRFQHCEKLLKCFSVELKKYHGKGKRDSWRQKNTSQRGRRAGIRVVGRSRSDKNTDETTDEAKEAFKSKEIRDKESFKKLAMEIDIVVDQIQMNFSRLFGSSQFIDPMVLWVCLAVKEDDGILRQVSLKGGATPSPLQNQNPQACNRIMNLRKLILDHLTILVWKRNVFFDGGTYYNMLGKFRTQLLSVENDMIKIDEDGISSSLEAISFLFPWLPKLRKDLACEKDITSTAEVSLNLAASLVSSYVRLMQSILLRLTRNESVSKLENKTAPLAVKDNLRLDKILHLCETQLKANDEANHGPVLAAPGDYRSRQDIIRNVYNAFLDNLRQSEDAFMAIQLIDILTVLAFQGEQKLVDSLLEANWRVLHTIYSVGSMDATYFTGNELPHAFLVSVEKHIALKSINKTRVVEKALKTTILKSAYTVTKEFEQHHVLKCILLAHWGLMAKSSQTMLKGLSYSSSLVSGLEEILVDIDGASENRKPTDDEGLDSCTPVTVPLTPTSRISRKKKPGPFVSPIPCLTSASFSVFFELTLHTLVGCFAVADPSSSPNKSLQPNRRLVPVGSGCGKVTNPFRHLEDVIGYFCHLVDLYMSHFKSFPKRSASTMFAACRQMLDLSEYQIHRCVEWRNSQPLLSLKEKKSGVHDFGSIKYLHEILNVFTSHCASKVLSLCEFARVRASRHSSNDGDNSEETWIFTSHHKKVTSLVMASEEVINAMRDVASAHNLLLPLLQAGQGGTKQSGGKGGFGIPRKNMSQSKVDKGFHALENDRKKQRKRLRPTLVTAGDDHRVAKDYNDIDSDSTNPFDGEDNSSGMVHSSAINDKKRRFAQLNDDDDIINDNSDWNESGGSDNEEEKSVESALSFGVDGDWEKSEEEASSGSLELEAGLDLFGAS